MGQHATSNLTLTDKCWTAVVTLVDALVPPSWTAPDIGDWLRRLGLERYERACRAKTNSIGRHWWGWRHKISGIWAWCWAASVASRSMRWLCSEERNLVFGW